MCNSRRTFETGFIAAAPSVERAVHARRESERPVGALTASCRSKTISSHDRSSAWPKSYVPHMAICRFEAILPAETLAPLGLGGRVAERPVEARQLHASPDLGESGESQAAFPARSAREPPHRRPNATSRLSSNGCGPVQRSTSRPKATSVATAACIHAQGNRRGPRAVCRPLALRGRVRPFPGRAAVDALSRASYAGAADIGTSLAAARPITTSALLATFLSRRPEDVRGPGRQCARCASSSTRCPGTSSSIPNCACVRKPR